MPNDCRITARLLAAQQDIFRLAERDHDITQKLVHLETGMSPSAIGQYARGETAMSGPAIIKLASMKRMPAELLSLLFDSTERVLIDTPQDEPDYDTTAKASVEYLAEHSKARSEDSPGGPAIVAVEKPALDAKRRRLAA